MFRNNAFVPGLILGFLLPIVGFGLFYGLFGGLDAAGIMNDSGFRPQFRERTAAVLGIALNLFALNYYQKRRFTDTMRGIVVSTFVFVVAWVLFFKDTLFAG